MDCRSFGQHLLDAHARSCRTGTSVVVVDDDIDAWKVRIARSGENYRDGFDSGLDCIRFGCRATTTSPSIPCRSIASTEFLPMRRSV
jgi:hypothetical protein